MLLLFVYFVRIESREYFDQPAYRRLFVPLSEKERREE